MNTVGENFNFVSLLCAVLLLSVGVWNLLYVKVPSLRELHSLGSPYLIRDSLRLMAPPPRRRTRRQTKSRPTGRTNNDTWTMMEDEPVPPPPWYLSPFYQLKVNDLFGDLLSWQAALTNNSQAGTIDPLAQLQAIKLLNGTTFLQPDLTRRGT